MSKMKQATLFSLKSWKNVAVEEIIKHKEILDKKDVTELAILKTIVFLKKNNPTKDSVLSSGIDSSLKLLTNHSNSYLSNEVKMLLKHWNFEDCSKYSNTIEACKENLLSKSHNFEEDKSEKVVHQVCIKSETISVTNALSDKNLSNKQPTNELCPLKVSTNLEVKNQEVSKTSISQASKSPGLKPITKMQTPKQICKKESVNQGKNRELNRRLQCAIQLFLEEVGNQEVRLYLEEQA